MTTKNQTPFFFVKTGHSIIVRKRNTPPVILSYHATNTKINIIKNNGLKTYLLHMYHKEIVEKEVTYKFICTLLINYQ